MLKMTKMHRKYKRYIPILRNARTKWEINWTYSKWMSVHRVMVIDRSSPYDGEEVGEVGVTVRRGVTAEGRVHVGGGATGPPVPTIAPAQGALHLLHNTTYIMDG